MNRRGRPKDRMTARRSQVLAVYQEQIAAGQRVRLMEIARRCGLHDYQSARRIVNDLKKLGRLPA